AHPCPYCAQAAGSGEIHVAGPGGLVFAAPALVWHYVTAHDYLPPEQFIQAVLSGTPVNPEPRDTAEGLAYLAAAAFIRRIKRRQPDPLAFAIAISQLQVVRTRFSHLRLADEAALLIERFEEFHRLDPSHPHPEPS